MSKVNYSIVTQDYVERKIFLLRDKKVMLDFDLAALYEVETKHLKRSVKRNMTRFPGDFMMELTREEYNSLRCQIGTLEKGEHTKYLPYAFTEQGVAMLSSVLRSQRAIEVNIAIMRAFVRLREILSTHRKLAKKISDLEKKYDGQFQIVFEAIRRLMEPPPEKKKLPFGFHTVSKES